MHILSRRVCCSLPRRAKSERPAGFTLVELLVVLGIIAVLVGILLPSLHVARQTAQAAACSSNLRQLVAAMHLYVIENQGYCPPAHYHFITQNLHRWHGTRVNDQSPFDFAGSPLRLSLQAEKIKECPTFVFSEGVGFERSAGGYGYNNAYLGSSTGDARLARLSLPIAEYERRVVNVPAKLSQIRRPAEKIAFADTAIAAPMLIEYSFVEAPLTVEGHPQSPSIHFRHRRQANIAWADGHVTRERMDWTYPTNVYGADNARFHLGYFGPKDNTLFTRE